MLNQHLRALPLGFSRVGRNRFGVSRYLFILVTLGIFITFYHTSFLRPGPFSLGWSPRGSHFKAPLKTESRFISWLTDRVPADHVPFVTIGDCQYIHALRNFRHRLDEWGYGDDLVVICLDQCCADASDYHAYTRYIGESVAYIKFSVNLDLTANGYNFVFFDGDAYLTGIDPFETMLPLSNDTWDIQFQTDHPEVLDWNIGWYFAKATEQTYQLFNRSYARWNETQQWDQYVMWEIGHPMETEENPLRVHHLNQTDYKNFMLYGLEYPFSGHDITQKFVSESTVVHFTCVEQSLKTYFGYYFGGFGDLDLYYSDSPPLIGMTNVSGMIDAIHAQVAFAAALSRKVHRTFIWPDTVNIMQKRLNATDNSTILEHQEHQSGIRAISWDSAQKAKLPAVEGNYLTNLKRVSHTELEIVYLDARAPIPTLEAEISRLSEKQVAMLDFAHFSPPIHQVKMGATIGEEDGADEGKNHLRGDRGLDTVAETAKWLEDREKEWFRESFDGMGYKAYSQTFLDKLKKCVRADLPTACLGACEMGV